MNPLLTGKLDQLLKMLQSNLDNGRNDRSQTQSPPPLNAQEATNEQTCDGKRLVQAGGRLAIPPSNLKSISSLGEEHLDRARMWLDDWPKKQNEKVRDDVLLVATKQLEHWTTFQRYWQWANRGGSAAQATGFRAFLSAMRKDYKARGKARVVANKASFEGMAKRKWEYEMPLHKAPGLNHESLETYTDAMRGRLESHGFTKPFALLADPRKQDTWTTWVEYLYYVCWGHDEERCSMSEAEPRYRQAMEELQSGGEARPSQGVSRESPSRQLARACQDLQSVCERFNKIREDSEAYLRHERLVRRGQLRINWVREQIALIEEERKEAVKEAESGGRQLRKRKSRHDEKEEEEEEKEDRGAYDDGAAAPSPLKRSRKGVRSTAITRNQPVHRSRRNGIGSHRDAVVYRI